MADVVALALTYGCGMAMNHSSSSLDAAAGAGSPDAPDAAAGADSRIAARSLPAVLAREIGQVALPLPFTPVPVTLGTLAALGVGGVLGGRRALGSVALYAAAAAAGAPVLAGWSSGVTSSFGYVLGYALAAVVAGYALSRTADGARRPLLVRLALMLLASAVVYIPGLIWLKVATGAAWNTAFVLGLAPFVIGDVLKSVVAALLPSRS